MGRWMAPVHSVFVPKLPSRKISRSNEEGRWKWKNQSKLTERARFSFRRAPWHFQKTQNRSRCQPGQSLLYVGSENCLFEPSRLYNILHRLNLTKLQLLLSCLLTCLSVRQSFRVAFERIWWWTRKSSEKERESEVTLPTASASAFFCF